MNFNPLIDLAVIVGFGVLLFIPVALEIRSRKKMPKPKGATKTC